MAQRRLRIVTGLAGLLVVAAGDSVLNERAIGLIASASAQESEETFEEDDEAFADEEAGDEASSDDSEEAEDDASWTGEEDGGSEQDSEESDESGAEEEEQAEPEVVADAPAEPQPPAVVQATPVSKRDRVFQIIVDATKEILPNLDGHAFQYSDSLRNLGANSVDRSEVIMMTLERLELKVPLMELAKAENIGALADLLAAKLP